MADQVARITAGVSAAVAVSSFAVSLATYRRGKPRVKLRIDFGVIGDRSEWTVSLRLRARNKAAVPAPLPRRLHFIHDRHRHRLLPRSLYSHGWIRGELPESFTGQIGPFSGGQWEMKLDARKGDLPETAKVYFELPDGRRVSTRWVRRHN